MKVPGAIHTSVKYHQLHDLCHDLKRSLCGYYQLFVQKIEKINYIFVLFLSIGANSRCMGYSYAGGFILGKDTL